MKITNISPGFEFVTIRLEDCDDPVNYKRYHSWLWSNEYDDDLELHEAKVLEIVYQEFKKNEIN